MKNSSDNRTVFFLALTLSGLALSACDKPRYDIKDTLPQAPVLTKTQPTAGGEPLPPTLPIEPSSPDTPADRDCTSLSLTRAGTAEFGTQGIAKTLPNYRKMKGQSIQAVFNSKASTVIRKNIVASDFSITPRMYDLGYPLQGSNSVLTNNKGQMVTENYGLRFDGHLTLQNPSDEGLYQFSMLADDGAHFEIYANGKWQTLVNYQGPHSTRMLCTNSLVRFSANQTLPFRIYYHQGPKLHIAHMLFWKKVESFAQDEACGQEGQKLFFDPKNQEPKAAYVDFMNRGWSIVPLENFIRPITKDIHPCFVPSEGAKK